MANPSNNPGVNVRRFRSIVCVKMAGRIESGPKGVKLSNSAVFSEFSKPTRAVRAAEHRFDEIRADEMRVVPAVVH
jgi:hypothetical protein